MYSSSSSFCALTTPGPGGGIHMMGGGVGGIPSGNHKVKVVVRLRPFIERERNEGAKNHWVVTPNELVHIDPDTQEPRSHHQQFMFDNVFGPEVTTKEIYEKVVSPIVSEGFNGFNGTVLCYGQTSSGKTHTLYGNETDPGIISFLAEDIQRRIEDVPAGKIVIRLNLIEIYNENVTDLLCSENPIEIVERDGSVIPSKAEHLDIFGGSDIIQAAQRLQRERRLGETRMNTQSSRSHTILRMTINTFDIDDDHHGTAVQEVGIGTIMEEEPKEFSGPGKRIISAVLNFVDLAGSEKASQTGASGERLREAGHINTSLSALSRVVSQLSKLFENTSGLRDNHFSSIGSKSTDPKVPRSRMPPMYHVSYRDSKLTRLLQSSLGGDALIAIVCNATPASSEETLSTLRFALSAKQIQTKPKRNLITDKLDKQVYERTIQELQAELFGKNQELKMLRESVNRKTLSEEYAASEDVEVLQTQVKSMEEKLLDAEEENERLREVLAEKQEELDNIAQDSQGLTTEMSKDLESLKQTIMTLQESLSTTQEENSTLNDQIIQMESSLRSIQEENRCLQDSILKKDEDLLSLTRRNAELLEDVNNNMARQESLSVTQEENSNLKDKISQLESNLRSSHEENQSLHDSIVKKDEDLRKIMQRNEELFEDFNNMKEERDFLQDNVDAALEHEKDVESQIRELEEKLKKCDETLIEAVTAKESVMKQLLDSATYERDLLQNAVLSLKENKLALETRVQEMEEQLKKLNENLTEAVIAKESVVKQLQHSATHEAEMLRNEVTCLKENKSALESRVQEMEEKLKESDEKLIETLNAKELVMKQQVDSAAHERALLENQVISLKEAKAVLDTRVQEMEERLKNLNETLSEAVASKDSAMRQLQDSASYERDMLQNEVACLKENKATLETRVQEMEEKLKESDEKLIEAVTAKELVMKQQLDSAVYERTLLQNQVVSLKETEAALDTRVQEMEEKLKKSEEQLIEAVTAKELVMKQQLDSDSNERDMIQNEVISLKENKATLETSVQEMKEKVKELNERLIEVTASKESAVKQLQDSASCERDMLQNEVISLKESKAALETKVQEKEDDLERYRAETQEKADLAERKVKDLEEQLSSVSQDILVKEQEIETLRGQGSNVKYTEKLKAEIRDRWEECNKYQTHIAELQKSLEEKEEEVSRLTEDLRGRQKNQKANQINHVDLKSLEECNKLKIEIEALRSAKDTEEALKKQIESDLSEATAEIRRLKETMMPPKPKTTRGLQTDWNPDELKNVVHKLKIALKKLEKERDDVKTDLHTANSTIRKNELAIQDHKCTIQHLQQFIKQVQEKVESAKLSKVDTGIQCQYIQELVQRQKRGERVQLPPEYPDLSKLQTEIRSLKGKIYLYEGRCQCGVANPDSRKRILSRPELKENSNPGRSEDGEPPHKKFVSKMGSTMDCKVKGGSIGVQLPIIGKGPVPPQPSPSPISTELRRVTSTSVSKSVHSQSSSFKVEPPKPSLFTTDPDEQDAKIEEFMGWLNQEGGS